MLAMVLVAAVLAGNASSAHANWLWTHWGESSEAIKAGAPEGVTFTFHTPNAGMNNGLYAERPTPSMVLKANFVLDKDGKLVGVSVTPADEAQCEMLRYRLVLVYGVGEADTHPELSSQAWMDRQTGDVISITTYPMLGPNNCDVMYTHPKPFML